MRVDVVLPGSGFPKLRSAVTLLRSAGMTILVDSGFVDDRARLLDALAELRLAPAAIDAVVTSHLHYDHCGNHLLFPRARWIVGALDYDDARLFLKAYHADETPDKSGSAETLRRRNEVIKDYYVRSIVREVTRNIGFYDAVHHGDGPFEPIVGNLLLTPEVEVIETPGHTPGHISVVARQAVVAGSDAPADVLVAGDAIFNRAAFHEHWAEGEAPPPHLATDALGYWRTRRQLLDTYTHVIPGHDVLVTRDSARTSVRLGRAS